MQISWGMDDWVVRGWGLVEIVMLVVWAAFVVGILALLALAIRWLLRQGQGQGDGAARSGGPGGSAASRPDDPLEILRQRYARGEIDDEEFERRRRVLGG